MTIRLGKLAGIDARIIPDANGRPYLFFVIWLPQRRNRLRYWYPAIPLSFR